MTSPAGERPRWATGAWSLAYVVVGYLGTAALATTVLVGLSGGRPLGQLPQATVALVQAGVGIVIFSGLSFLVGRRILKLDRRELGWAPSREGLQGFGTGFGLGLTLGALALSAGVLVGVAHWSLDGGSFGQYLTRLAQLAVLLLPAALMEELAFRGLPLAGFRRAVGPGLAIVVTAVLFGLAHRLNPALTALGLGNITLAGIWLGLVFYAPGGLWTATGAHLGWNLALAGLAAPVSGIPFSIPWIDYFPGRPAWLTGGGFGPEGGVFATVALALGVGVAARWWTTREDG